MHFGTYMGIYWIAKFTLFPLGFTNPFFKFLFIGLTLGVPFMGYRYARMYRDKACEGEMSFLSAWLFMIFMYMFAALLTAVAHYIYFRFIDNGFIAEQMTANIELFPTELPNMKEFVDLMNATIETMNRMSPIELTMQLLSSNFLACSFLSLITAPFLVRRKPVNTP